MITIKTITMKNFLSVGNTAQTITLNSTPMTLVLGNNLDQGNSGNGNGSGKTSCLQGISFALFGAALTNIRKDNLINATNQKHMEVSLDFSVNDRNYRIERGRKPHFLRYFVNDSLVNAPDTDESHGESKWTQREIERVIGMSHTLFRHIVALHTKTVPFLSLGDKAQRDIIEELISITQLSEKAENLKLMIKEIRDEIRHEDIRIQTIVSNNTRVQKAIDELNFKSRVWDKEHTRKLDRIAMEITQLELIDVDAEIQCHRTSTKWFETAGETQTLRREVDRYTRQHTELERQIQQLLAQQAQAEAHSCPTCGQDVHDSAHDRMQAQLNQRMQDLIAQRDQLQEEQEPYAQALAISEAALATMGEQPQCHYESIERALGHKNQLQQRHADLQREAAVENPTIEQIANLSMTAMQDVNYDYLNELTSLREHQEFLLKLLTSKDSFIRKKIIDQNLNYLNNRLNGYLTRLGLPHEVVFQSDLSVAITQLGKDFDFEQLSNGEANRLVLALSWSFRDMWENMHQPLNIMIIDELVDSGMDGAGTDASLNVLKSFTRERNKNVFLISHKEGLEPRVDAVLVVTKENGFTSYADAVDAT